MAKEWFIRAIQATVITVALAAVCQEMEKPAEERHWHGAAPTTSMTHIALQEQLDGKAVEWMEKVSDEQYTPNVA